MLFLLIVSEAQGAQKAARKHKCPEIANILTIGGVQTER